MISFQKSARRLSAAWVLVATWAILNLAFEPRALAFTFTPMSVSLGSIGREATHSFEVENDSDSKVALEVSMAHRKFNEAGEEQVTKITAAEKLFLTYPTQLLLGPKEKRTIRVSWVGEKSPKAELAFRIIAEQLPVQTEKPQGPEANAVIKMLLKYMGSVYITPKNAAPAVVVRSAIHNTRGELELLLENKGSAHQVLMQAQLKLGELGLPPELLLKLNGQNLLAGDVRKLLLPWPKSWPIHAKLVPVAFETGK